MPSFKKEVPLPSGVSKEKAVASLKFLLEKVRDKYKDQIKNLEDTWDEEKGTLVFSFRTYGFDIKGDVTVDDEKVSLKGDLPFAAMMFKGRIEQSIGDEINRELEAVKAKE